MPRPGSNEKEEKHKIFQEREEDLQKGLLCQFQSFVKSKCAWHFCRNVKGKSAKEIDKVTNEFLKEERKHWVLRRNQGF